LSNGALGLAESPPQPALAFDVASVKLNKSGDASSGTAFSHGGAFISKNATFKGLILEAFRLKEDCISGAPEWLDSERYDIMAKPAGPVSDNEARIMLQSLLADRFHFQFHREVREFRGYALSVAKSGLKLKEATDSNWVEPPVGLPSSLVPGRRQDIVAGQ
jgi:uncharacterized protein (TIGR03435 family)